MPIQRLKKFLDENDVRYTSIRHAPAVTAQEVAASAHIPDKVVMVLLDHKMAMAVLPGQGPERNKIRVLRSM